MQNNNIRNKNMQMLAIIIFAIPSIGIVKKIFDGYAKFQKIEKVLGHEATEWTLMQGGMK